jgi:hypothetical protein
MEESMNSRPSHPRTAGGLAGRLRAWLFVGLAAGAAACDTLDDLVGVDPPDRIAADVFEVPGNAPTLVAGAIGDFECALASFIVGTGLTADELMITGSNVQWYSFDRRSFATAGLLGAGFANSTCANHTENTIGVYRPVSTARWQADNVLQLLEGWTDAEVANRNVLIATMAAYSGYSHLLLGESMCTAAIDLGPELTPAQLFALAEGKFTKAISTAGAPADIVTMALVGRARTRLNLGRKADAATDARLVPATYVRNATFSATTLRRNNFVYYENRRDIVVVEGPFRALTDMGVTEPRVRVTDTGRRFAQSGLPIWYQEKYPGLNTPIPIARGVEAQLIVAEAEVAAGNLSQAVAIINTLHRRAGVQLPDFPGGTAAEVLNHIIYERSAELFLEGQRLMDIKRYNLPLTPVPGTPYPLGGVYGNETCYPMPDVERNNNPNT